MAERTEAISWKADDALTAVRALLGKVDQDVLVALADTLSQVHQAAFETKHAAKTHRETMERVSGAAAAIESAAVVVASAVVVFLLAKVATGVVRAVTGKGE